MDPNFIISPIMGAAIGGFANWLAIQMLFYPLTEKRVFGIRIPFTPGLVPKERKRIAESVANTVANYFLSEDVIVNAVVSPNAEEQFKQYIRDTINKQKESKETLDMLVKNIMGTSVKKLYEDNEEKILDFIEQQLKSPEFIRKIAESLKVEADKVFDKTLVELTEKGEQELGEEAAQKIHEILNSDALVSSLGEVTASQLKALSISKKKLGDVLPDGVTEFFKVKSVSNSDKVAEMIVEFITSSAVQFKMRKFLRNSFESSFKLRMLSKVVDIEKVFENILEELVAFLEHPESRREIANFLLKTIDSFENKKVKDITEEYGIEIIDEKVLEVIKALAASIGEKDNILNVISESGIVNKTISQLADLLGLNLVKEKEKFIERLVDFAKDSISLKEILRPVLKVKVEEISGIESGKVLGFLQDKEISMLEDAAVSNFKKLIRGESDKILKVIDVSKIVEDKINGFDIGEMEEIMLGVIRKDIVVMRAFEAGIGFLIGFFIPLYPYILRLFK